MAKKIKIDFRSEDGRFCSIPAIRVSFIYWLYIMSKPFIKNKLKSYRLDYQHIKDLIKDIREELLNYPSFNLVELSSTDTWIKIEVL